MRYFFFNKAGTQVLELQADEVKHVGEKIILRQDGNTTGELNSEAFAGWVLKEALPTIYSPVPGETEEDD